MPFNSMVFYILFVINGTYVGNTTIINGSCNLKDNDNNEELIGSRIEDENNYLVKTLTREYFVKDV